MDQDVQRFETTRRLVIGHDIHQCLFGENKFVFKIFRERNCWNVCQEAPLSWVVFVFDKITICDCLETEECRNWRSRKDLGTDDTYVVKSNSISDTKRRMSLQKLHVDRCKKMILVGKTTQ